MSLAKLALIVTLGLGQLVDRGKANPGKYERSTPVQQEFLEDASALKAFVGANQVGKTLTGGKDALGRMRGEHPGLGRWRAVPVHGWCVNSSWSQSLIIQRKVHELLSPDELAPCVKYTNKRGFTGGYIELTNGSTLTFVTCHQDTVDIASATLDFVWIDEPPPEHVWGELVSRVRVKRGTIFLTMTPINRPVEWIREKCEGNEKEGIVASISATYAPLTVANCTPIGLLPFITQAEIDKFAADLLPIERAQRVHAAWEGVSEGRIFEAFADALVTEEYATDLEVDIGIGIDHGAKAGRQLAVLVASCMILGKPRVWVLDEAHSDGRSTSEDDARAILEMLTRNQLALKHVDWWRGDRAHGGDRRGNQKSNRDLKRAFALLTSTPTYQLPRPLQQMTTPRKWDGSVAYGCRLINKLMADDRLTIHPRCVAVIDGMRHWEGDSRDPKKDALDAVRYIVEKMIDARAVWGGMAARSLVA